MTTILQDVHCPGCGRVAFEDGAELPQAEACPNKCGWVEAGAEGDSLVVTVGVCSY